MDTGFIIFSSIMLVVGVVFLFRTIKRRNTLKRNGKGIAFLWGFLVLSAASMIAAELIYGATYKLHLAVTASVLGGIVAMGLLGGLLAWGYYDHKTFVPPKDES